MLHRFHYIHYISLYWSYVGFPQPSWIFAVDPVIPSYCCLTPGCPPASHKGSPLYRPGMASHPSCPMQQCPPGSVPCTLSNPKCHGPQLQSNLLPGGIPSGKGLPVAAGTTGNYVQGGKVPLPPFGSSLSRHCLDRVCHQ